MDIENILSSTIIDKGQLSFSLLICVFAIVAAYTAIVGLKLLYDAKVYYFTVVVYYYETVA